MSYNPFVVVDAHAYRLGAVKILGDSPSPMLISVGHNVTEAYLYDGWQWRARDDKFDAEGTEYFRVYVIRNPEPDPYDLIFGQ